ncbi:MAG: protein translocase subunit SecDF, partial [Aurantimonas coralicida]
MLYFSRWKTFLIWLTVAIGVLYASPNVLPQQALDKLPSWFPQQSVTLGLDLQGGSYILLEVDSQSLVADRVQTLRDDARQALRTERIGYAGLSDNDRTVTIRLRDPEQVAAAREALSPMTDPISSGSV